MGDATGVMYLKCHKRRKDGKEHQYWSVAEHVAGASGRRFERHVLYLGELGEEQRDAWALRAGRFDGDGGGPRQTLLFPAERMAEATAEEAVGDVRIRLSEFSLRRPRQWRCRALRPR